MKTNWKPLAVAAAVWLAVAGFVHGAMVVFLGGPLPLVVPAILAAGAVHLAFIKKAELEADRILKRGVAVMFLAFAVWLAAPQSGGTKIEWQPYSPVLVDAARRGGRPVMIDFTSKLCPPCHAMDRNVFSRPRVVNAASDFLALRADLTQDTPENRRIGDQYNIRVFPTVVFLDEKGKERTNLRLEGFERSEHFLQRLQAAR